MRELVNAAIDAVNRWGELHVSLAVPMAIQVSLLVAALLAIDLLLRRRARAIVRYWLWALVLLKLMLPLSLGTPASIAYWIAEDRPAETAIGRVENIPVVMMHPAPAAPAFVPHPVTEAAPLSPVVADSPARPMKSQHAETAEAPTPLHRLTWQGGLFLAWAAVVGTLFSVLALRTWKVRKIVRLASDAPPAIRAILGQCAARLHVVAAPRLKITDRLGSPAICGFLRPTILMPANLLDELDGEQIRLVFIHELVHWKRFDLHVNWLQTILQVMYFYNPAVWLAAFMLRRLREQAVDEAVLVALGESQRYGATLLDIAALSSRAPEPMLRLIGVVESPTALDARIRRIVARPIPRSARLGIAGSLLIVLVAIGLLPMAGRRTSLSAAPAVPSAENQLVLADDVAEDSSGQPADEVLSGRITDDTGAAVTDAEIQLQPANRRGKVLETKTDEDGRYRFERIAEPGEYQVQIKSKRWIGITDFRKRPRVNLSSKSQLVRNFTFQRAAQLRIQVVNEEGLPVRSASVYTNLLSNESYRGSETVRTDKTGWATLDSLKPSAGTRIVAVSSDAYGFAHILLVLNEPELSEHRITVEKGEPVVGKALCTDGKPAAGWHVSALPTWWHFGAYPTGTTIAADGSFTLPHVVGDKYNVSVSIPIGQGMSMVKPVKNDIVLPTADGKLALTVDHPSPGTDVAISGKIRWEGKTLEQGIHASAVALAGRALAHYDCYIQPGQNEFKFERLPSGVYRVAFESPEFESVVLPKVKAPTTDLDVTINVRGRLKFAGTVVEADNQQPVREFRVLVNKLRSLSQPNYQQEKTWHEFQNDEGKFSVDVVGPGVYVAAVEAKGIGARQSDPVTIEDLSAPSVRIELGGGKPLQGTVVDERGRPIDGAIVVPVMGPSWAHRIALARTSEPGAVETVRGKFALSPLASGQETLKVSHPDYAPTVVNLANEDSSAAKPLKITLKPGATLRGHVHGERGEPQPGVTLFISDGGAFGGNGDDEANRLATVVSDANGYYEVRHLPPVMLQVTRSDKWQAMGVVEQMILIEDGQTQTLDFGGPTRLTGRLVVNGKPLAGVNIILSSDSPYSSVFRANGRTDDDGVFALFGIPPGEKTLYYSEGQRTPPVKAAKFKVARGMEPLGTIHSTIGKLTVRCRPDAAIEAGDLNVHVAEFDPIWYGRNFVGHLVRGPAPQDPFVFDQLPLGSYVVVANRPSHLSVHKIVEITPDNLNPTVELTLPGGTASLSGKFAEALNKTPRRGNLKLWSADEQLMGYIAAKEDGSYRVDNLPAGEYRLKEKDTRDAETLVTITLKDGEAKKLDITAEMLKAAPIGFAVIRTYTSGGVPLVGCDVRFDNEAGAPEVHSSQNGRMGIVGQPGAYKASIEYPGFKPLEVTLELKLAESGQSPPRSEPSYRLEEGE